MALWDKLKTELDRAGKAAQTAFDEGKVRLEVLRVRQLADKAAQTLGYEVYRARQGGQELDAESYARLSSTLAAHEAEVQRLEAQLAAAKAGHPADQPAPAATATATAAGTSAGTSPGAGPAETAPVNADAAPSSTSASAESAAPPMSAPPTSVDPALGDLGRTEPPYSPS